MERRRMFLRMVAAALARRKSRAGIAFAAIVAGVAVTSGLATVYYDTGQKMGRELRAYGANLVLVPVAPELRPSLSLDDVSAVADTVGSTKLLGYAPYRYGTAWLGMAQVVVVGVPLDRVQVVTPYWKITRGARGIPAGQDGALVGEKLAAALSIAPGDRLELRTDGAPGPVGQGVAGILSTGGAEDGQVFVDLEVAGKLLGAPGLASLAYFSVAGDLPDLQALAREIGARFPGIAASPILRISRSEGLVLEKIRSLVFLGVALILLLTALCVAVVMMNMAAERRKEIGLKKALGAADRGILLEFLAEGCLLGLAGGLAGWALGQSLAHAIVRSVFHSSLTLRPEVLPVTVLGAGILVALSAFVPARAAARVDPALTLKGE